MGLNKAILAILLIAILPIVASWWLIFNYSLQIGMAYTVFGLSILVIIMVILIVKRYRD